MAFESSKEQLEFYDFITNGYGNAILSATAGSGKTFSIIKGIDLIPKDKTILILAFNKSISKEMAERVPYRNNIHVQTVHSYGRSCLSQDYDFEVSSTKYITILRNIVKYLKDDNYEILSPYKFERSEMNLVEEMRIDLHLKEIEDQKGYYSRILKLCNLGRLDLINIDDRDKGIDDLNLIAKKHDIKIIDGESFRAWNLIKLGIFYTEVIDITDMIYLPIVFKPNVRKYDFVFTDEIQDFNTCQRELMLMAKKEDTGRHIGVGDKKQSIYGFMGANTDSFDEMCNLPNTVVLSLSVSYRCPKEVIKLAQEIVPQIQHSEFAKDGAVYYDSDLTKIKDGDMVLCRQTYPIVKLCLKLLSSGRKAKIMGGDIGKSIITTIKNTKRQREEWSLDSMYSILYKNLKTTLENTIKTDKSTIKEAKNNKDYQLQEEQIMVIEALSKNIDEPKELIEKIKGIFNDESKGGIMLSTIHKSKGLEAENVFIIHPELMPSKYATQDWEVEQEEHLRYVAYTRTKDTLHFIEKNTFNAWGDRDSEDQSESIEVLTESEWIGTIGEKLPIQLTVTYVKEIESNFGTTILFELKDKKGNKFVKFGTINKRYIVSNHEVVTISTDVKFCATIKKHQEFRGEKSTLISTLSKFN